MDAITPRQIEVLTFIARHIKANSYPPTRQEIASHFGFAPNGAEYHVRALESKRYITIHPGVARGIVLSDKASAMLEKLRNKK